jgi:hypothetical protein
MTYALPWRYSTTELKGPIPFSSIHEEATPVDSMSLLHVPMYILLFLYMDNVHIYMYA